MKSSVLKSSHDDINLFADLLSTAVSNNVMSVDQNICVTLFQAVLKHDRRFYGSQTALNKSLNIKKKHVIVGL